MKNPLDSRQLCAFYHVANTGSFTQGGRAVGLSQSAISRAIQTLEQDVGCRLLDRLGKKVALTQAGEQLLQHAKKTLADAFAVVDDTAERWLVPTLSTMKATVESAQ